MRRGVWTWLRNGFQSDALMKIGGPHVLLPDGSAPHLTCH